MGYDQSEIIKTVTFENFAAGWFPGKNHTEIPGELNDPTAPIGSPDCEHAWWNLGGLRKSFGYGKLTTGGALDGAVYGLAEFREEQTLIGVAGTKIYKDLDTTSHVDITGSLTISSTNYTDFTKFRSGATIYMIGSNKDNPIWKWTGTGDAALLGGSPPQGRFVRYWQNYVCIANWLNNEEVVQISGLRDAESYNVLHRFRFDDEITAIESFDRYLVVFKRNTIGVLTGFTRSSFQKVVDYVTSSGCVAPESVSKGFLMVDGKQREVIFYLADDGFYAFDGTKNPIKLSNSIEEKFISSSSVENFREARLDKAVGVYVRGLNTYEVGISDGNDTTNDFHLRLDTQRQISLKDRNQRIAYPWWPSDGVEMNAISTMKDSDNVNNVYFGDSSGDMFKFDMAIYNEQGNAYNSYFKSKIFDPGLSWILREPNLFMDEVGDYDISFYLNSDLTAGDGTVGTANMADTASVLGSFILGTSALSGKDFLFLFIGIEEDGRFLQWKIEQNVLDQNYVLQKLELVLSMIGRQPNAS